MRQTLGDRVCRRIRHGNPGQAAAARQKVVVHRPCTIRLGQDWIGVGVRLRVRLALGLSLLWDEGQGQGSPAALSSDGSSSEVCRSSSSPLENEDALSSSPSLDDWDAKSSSIS